MSATQPPARNAGLIAKPSREIAMTTTPPSTLFAPDIRLDENPLLRRARQNLPPERTSAISERCTALPTPSSSAAHLFGRTVEISPTDAVKRHSTGRYEMLI